MITISRPKTVDIFTLLRHQIEDCCDYTNTSIDITDSLRKLLSAPACHETRTAVTISGVEANSKEWGIKALCRLQKVAGLARNWDNQGSPGTAPEIVDAAAYLLKRLQDEHLGVIPVPFVCPIAGGGLQFEWSTGQKHLELELPDKNTIVFLKEEGERMDSGQYPLSNIERTLHLLDWFATV